MEANKNFTEKESLELIAGMIRATKKRMEVGSGNVFLYYGYCTLALSVIIYLLVQLTGNALWHIVWFLMFAVWGGVAVADRKRPQSLVTYTDKAVSQVWQVVGCMFVITPAVLLLCGVLTGRADFGLMMPLSLLYVSMGVSITGVIIREPSAIYLPFAGAGIAIYMLALLIAGQHATALWNLYFGIPVFLMMVVPGYIINHKAKGVC